MKALKYKLTNGTIVTTLREAQVSGQGYTAFTEKVAKKPSVLSPMRKAMIEQFGYVSSSLKDKIVM